MSGTLLALLALPHALASRLAVTPAQVCAWSDLVVVAEVTGAQSRWAAGQEGSIETVHDLWIERVVRGVPPATGVEVLVPGGAMGAVVMQRSETARLGVDGRYLLMLTGQADGSYVVTGGPDGVVALPSETALQHALTALGSCR